MEMDIKDFRDISWNVTEEEYRNDPYLSYSTLATYERGGFNALPSLFDKKESPSLTFGSAVDSILTGGMDEFNERFIVADFPELPESIVKIVKSLFSTFKDKYNSLSKIPTDDVIYVTQEEGYQPNWKAETRVKVIKEKGAEYYGLLYIVEGGKTIITQSMYEDVLKTVDSLRNSESTRKYFAEDNPFEPNIKHYYQLKFKGVLNRIGYRSMADLIVVDYKNKVVYPCDLKTSSHYEWDFFKSFVEWNYSIQAKLYWRLIRQAMDNDKYFKDFSLSNYRFIVVNKNSLTPLVWEFEETQSTEDIVVGSKKQIIMRDPETIGKELYYYLNNDNKVPVGIECDKPNSLLVWLNKM